MALRMFRVTYIRDGEELISIRLSAEDKHDAHYRAMAVSRTYILGIKPFTIKIREVK